MKRRCVLYAILFILLFAACKKKGNETTASKGTTPTITSTVTPVFTPTITPTYPYADTFYGNVYEGNFNIPVISDTTAYIYAYHLTLDSIRFSSNYFVPGEPNNYKGFGQTYMSNDSNYYIEKFSSKDYAYFQISGSSITYYNAQPSGPDELVAEFIGNKL